MQMPCERHAGTMSLFICRETLSKPELNEVLHGLSLLHLVLVQAHGDC